MKKTSYEQLQDTSYLSGNSAPYIEALYEDFLQNPEAVGSKWRSYFESVLNGVAPQQEVSHQQIEQTLKELASQPKKFVAAAATSELQEAVDDLIRAYRDFGHIEANINPLEEPKNRDPRLSLSYHKLSEKNFSEKFMTRGVLKEPVATLKEIYTALRQYYCGTTSFEYCYVLDEQERRWLREYIEHTLPFKRFDKEAKLNILKKLTAAEGLEKHLESKYPGVRRFSVEGCDSVIPMLDALTKSARAANVCELVLGMAHRGRLNVLLNIMGQSPEELFQEFEGRKDYGMTTGDVKYHRGFSSDVITPAGAIHLSMMFNPSHLEFVNTVVMGSVRARQERVPKNSKLDYALAILLHGDAAFSGQGVVMEALAMSQTRGYKVGGTLHIVTNNQVGFTSSDIRDARSSLYCTDIAKMINAPVVHVNGDDAEAVVAVAQMALDYRMKFHKDFVVDLVCYRRHGHQEVDEPRITQPLMYKVIDQHSSPREIYIQRLVQEKLITEKEAEQWIQDYRDRLEAGGQVVETSGEGVCERYAVNWAPYLETDPSTTVDTTIPMDKLKFLAEKLSIIPKHFKLHRGVEMIMNAREKMSQGELPIDWGYAEVMAYASLLEQGYSVRISGEDARRGTFAHRHGFVFNQETGESYTPLAHLSDRQAHIQIYDSLLAEAGPVGFEYGYSTAEPNALVIWEAQFGDFANVAQVLIDQFLSSGWQKWRRLSGLTLFLPHGNEGLGPEHSSARLERYLQLCAQDNMQVFVPSTPAQIFHLLRRQVLRPLRIPLIVMSPKSLLRHKLAVSSLNDLVKTQLQLVIPEIDNDISADKVKRVVFCCGKVYFELLTERREKGIKDIALVRIEQLYPFPYDEVKAIIKQYTNAKEIVWCQDEPKNQGAWFCTRDRILKCLPKGKELICVSRPPMAAPAAGYPLLHKKEQEKVVNQALGPVDNSTMLAVKR